MDWIDRSAGAHKGQDRSAPTAAVEPAEESLGRSTDDQSDPGEDLSLPVE